MIILLASFPRSGSNFFVIAACRSLGMKVATLYDEPPSHGPVRPPDGLENRLWRLRESILAAKAGREGHSADAAPLLLKTHEVSDPQDSRPAVQLVRDGRDVLVSYAHYARANHPADTVGMTFDEVLEAMVRSEDHFGGWSRNVHSWLDRSPPTAIVRFEELIARPEATVRGAVERFAPLPVRAVGDVPSFGDLRALWPELFRKGRAGAWREEMPPAIEDLFWKRHGDAMRRLGYPRRP